MDLHRQYERERAGHARDAARVRRLVSMLQDAPLLESALGLDGAPMRSNEKERKPRGRPRKH